MKNIKSILIHLLGGYTKEEPCLINDKPCLYVACDKNKELYLFDDIPHKNSKNTTYDFSGKTEYTRVFKKIGYLKNINYDNSPKKLIII